MFCTRFYCFHQCSCLFFYSASHSECWKLKILLFLVLIIYDLVHFLVVNFFLIFYFNTLHFYLYCSMPEIVSYIFNLLCIRVLFFIYFLVFNYIFNEKMLSMIINQKFHDPSTWLLLLAHILMDSLFWFLIYRYASSWFFILIIFNLFIFYQFTKFILKTICFHNSSF